MAARVTAAYRCERANEGVTNEVYGDLLMCAAPPWNLDLLAAALELEQIGKGKLRVPRARPGPKATADGHWVATG